MEYEFVLTEKQMKLLFNFLNKDYPTFVSYQDLLNGNVDLFGEPIKVREKKW